MDDLFDTFGENIFGKIKADPKNKQKIVKLFERMIHLNAERYFDLPTHVLDAIESVNLVIRSHESNSMVQRIRNMEIYSNVHLEEIEKRLIDELKFDYTKGIINKNRVVFQSENATLFCLFLKIFKFIDRNKLKEDIRNLKEKASLIVINFFTHEDIFPFFPIDVQKKIDQNSVEAVFRQLPIWKQSVMLRLIDHLKMFVFIFHL